MLKFNINLFDDPCPNTDPERSNFTEQVLLSTDSDIPVYIHNVDTLVQTSCRSCFFPKCAVALYTEEDDDAIFLWSCSTCTRQESPPLILMYLLVRSLVCHSSSENIYTMHIRCSDDCKSNTFSMGYSLVDWDSEFIQLKTFENTRARTEVFLGSWADRKTPDTCGKLETA